MEIDGVRLAASTARLRTQLASDRGTSFQQPRQRLEDRRRSTPGDDRPTPAGDRRVWINAEMSPQTPFEAGLR